MKKRLEKNLKVGVGLTQRIFLIFGPPIPNFLTTAHRESVNNFGGKYNFEKNIPSTF
jgi:hypothetical protein